MAKETVATTVNENSEEIKPVENKVEKSRPEYTLSFDNIELTTHSVKTARDLKGQLIAQGKTVKLTLVKIVE